VTTTSEPESTTASVAGRTLTANATLALVLASIVNSLLHEGAHAVATLAYGFAPTLSPFSVDVSEPTTTRQEIVIALAGPLFSLVLGLVMMGVARNWGRGIVRFFWMWLAALGVMNFVGYCFIAPIAKGGDTGQALALLGAPWWVFVVVCVAGIGGQFWLARRFAVELKRYAADKQAERHIAYFPWLIATAIMVVITVVEVFLMHAPAIYVFPVVAYAVAFAVFAPMQFIFSAGVSNRFETLDLQPVNRVAIALVIVVVAFDIILAGIGGIRLG
jgi:hypothetical protein